MDTTTTTGRLHFAALGILAALSGLSSACSRTASAETLSKTAPDEEPVPNVPVPAADGPKLFVLQSTPVFERPSVSSRALGELRPGAAVARSVEPYTHKGCDGGWYVVRPRGFVCAGPIASASPTPAFTALGADLSRAMPYRYGKARSEAVPVYARVPSAAEQAATEPDLKRQFARRAAEEQELLGASANDVPLDARGVATGPAVLIPGGDGVDATSKRTLGAFFAFPSPDAPAPSAFGLASTGDVKFASLRKGSGVALASTFVADGGLGPRRFGVTADGHVVPIDRLKPALGVTWHGVDLTAVNLPIAFVLKRGVHTWRLAHGHATKLDDEVERRAAIPMSNKFRTVDSVRYEETRDGDWLRSSDVVPVVKRGKFPDFVHAGLKWIDISLAYQTLTAYEGTKAIYVTLISSGRDQLGDASQGAATARGIFKVTGKSVTKKLDDRNVHGSFDLTDVPWVLDLEQGQSLAAAYWGDPVGDASSFHDVLLTPIDARRIWAWADPELPESWSSIADGGESATIVNIRP
jgi:hypothetical protein